MSKVPKVRGGNVTKAKSSPKASPETAMTTKEGMNDALDERLNMFAFHANKGGVGKTTVALTIAMKAAGEGKTVIFIDGDPQCNATRFFLGVDASHGTDSQHYDDCIAYSEARRADKPPSEERKATVDKFKAKDFHTTNIFDLLTHSSAEDGYFTYLSRHKEIGLEIKTPGPGKLRLVLGNPMGDALEPLLANEGSRFPKNKNLTPRFRILVREMAERYQADLCIVDLGPSLSLFNQYAIMTANFLVPVVDPCDFAIRSLSHLSSRLGDMRKQWDELWMRPELLTVVFNKYAEVGGPLERAVHNTFLDSLRTKHIPEFLSKQPHMRWESNMNPYENLPVIEHLGVQGPVLIKKHMTAYDLGQGTAGYDALWALMLCAVTKK